MHFCLATATIGENGHEAGEVQLAEGDGHRRRVLFGGSMYQPLLGVWVAALVLGTFFL